MATLSQLSGCECIKANLKAISLNVLFTYRDGSINAGFNEGHKPWLPMSVNYKCINVETERDDAVSHLNVYKKLVAIRKQLVGASFSSRVYNDAVLVYERLVEILSYRSRMIANINGNVY